MLVDRMEGFEKLSRLFPELKLTLDLGHLHCQREFPLEAKVRQFAPWVVNVHIEDMKAGVHDHLMFGEGEIDFPPVLRAFREIDYQGGLHVELSRHSHMAPTAAKRAAEFLAPLLGDGK